MRAAVFVALCVLAAASASAQSLADVARQEGERRQVTPAAGKSYSNKDLKPTRTVETGDSSSASTDAAAGVAPGSAEPSSDAADAAKDASASTDADATDEKAASKKADKDGDTKDEKYWAKRIADLRDQLERDQTFLQALQGRVDSLTTDFVNRDDPAQRGQIAGDRQKALAELERLRKAIEADKRAIPELEDEARRSGVPAGWLR